jgi:hypothetical protein
MIKFISFSFSGDKFYQQKTTIPLGDAWAHAFSRNELRRRG